MMKTMTVIFDGEITAPLGYASSKNSKKDRAKNTQYQALPVSAGRFVLPGEQLAGALRRAGMNDIRDAFEEEPLTSILSFYQACVGGIAGFGKQYKMGEMTDLRRRNPFVSLWGKAGVRGHLGLGHAVGPVTETVTVHQGKEGPYTRVTPSVERVHGFRSDDLARDPETDVPASFWSQREVLRFAGASPETAKQVAEFAERKDFFDFPLPNKGDAVALEADADEAEDPAGGEKEKGKLTNIQNGYGGFEYLPNSTTFTHRFSLTGTEDEIVMLMASFNGFARQPRLGGHWRHNLGWVNMRYTVYLRDDDPRLAPREIGSLSINSHMDDLSGPALTTTGKVSEWMDAYLNLRREGFPGMDINAGVEDEAAVIQANLKKIAGKARKDAEKKGKKDQNKKDEKDNGVSDVQGATQQEVKDVA
ncbi:MAG: hypothetical protein ACYCR3_08115 [Acidithiobacillus sp.]